MTDNHTLLSFIAQRHSIGLEDVATDALFFILSHSAPARQALSDLLGYQGDPLPMSLFRIYRPVNWEFFRIYPPDFQGH